MGVFRRVSQGQLHIVCLARLGHTFLVSVWHHWQTRIQSVLENASGASKQKMPEVLIDFWEPPGEGPLAHAVLVYFGSCVRSVVFAVRSLAWFGANKHVNQMKQKLLHLVLWGKWNSIWKLKHTHTLWFKHSEGISFTVHCAVSVSCSSTYWGASKLFWKLLVALHCCAKTLYARLWFHLRLNKN